MLKRKQCSVWIAAALCFVAIGCMSQEEMQARKDKGLVVVLPGIEGKSNSNANIKRGLDQAEVPGYIVIYDWGFPVPGFGLLVNQTDVGGNRRAGEKLAKKLMAYQKAYPGRPVFLIGHSGGTGIAVFALEHLRRMRGEPIEGVFLLASSMSANYPLNTALSMTRRGIVNVYNPRDTAALQLGTGIFGNVDGGRGATAGMSGFTSHYPKLFQTRVQSSDVSGPTTAHDLATTPRLVARQAPKWLNSDVWPPAGTKVRK
jgi:pimeloyl-ACP methyl ester carboxylesterase